MGQLCSKRKQDNPNPLSTSRISPFGRFARRNSVGECPVPQGCSATTLLTLALDAVCANLHTFPLHQLKALPPDLSQLILDRLIATARLNDSSVFRLQGQHFYQLILDGYPEPIRDFWLRYLAIESLEKAIIRCTTIDDQVFSALSHLPKLHTLHLDFCLGLTDAGILRLPELPALTDLNLAGCDGLTAEAIPHIAILSPSLKTLNLEQCHKIRTLRYLRVLHQLESLDLGWCSGVGDGDMAAVGQLGQLKTLRISHTQVSDVGLNYLKALTSLISFSLGGLSVSDAAVAAVLSNMHSMKKLDLERCGKVEDGTLRVLSSSLTQLQDLDVSYTDVSDGGLDSLVTLRALTRLNLDSTSAGDRGLEMLSKLSNLRILDLSDTLISAATMPHIGSLPHLHSLNLSFTSVENSGLRELSGCPALKRLNLDSRHFSDDALLFVAKIPNLETLDLFGASITDTGCIHLGKMKALKSLEVCGGGVSDVGVARIAALTGLRHLSLGQNYRVTNTAISNLIKLPHLTALNLSQCRVNSTSIVALGCLHELQVLSLHGTRVKPIAVEKLRAMNPDLEVRGVRMPDVGI